MKVSVVIPMFNSEAYVGEALSSVAAQTYRDVDVVIVDDGSTDDSVSRASSEIERLGLSATVISRPESEPKGAGSCRNVGARRASGDVIAFLDSDDIWLPDHLERAVTVFVNKGDGLAVYCAQATTFRQESSQTSTLPEGGFRDDGVQQVLPQLLARMFVPTQTLCVRREAFERTTGFSTELSCYEDWWLVLQLASISMFYLDTRTGCLVRERWNSLSRSLDSERGLVMSPAMYRDQVRLYNQAKERMLLPAADLGRLRNEIISRNRKEMSDHLCAGHFAQSWRISAALIAGGRRPAGLAALIILKSGSDTIRRLFSRMSRDMKKKGNG